MKILLILAFILPSLAEAQISTPYWMSQKYQKSTGSLVRNINPTGKLPGVVIASPSKVAPNYYYHWVRDAALVMNSIVDLYIIDNSSTDRKRWDKMLVDYAIRGKQHQEAKALTGLGEPKFNVDGTAYDGPWGRPQYDGPALRAATLSRLAAVWMQNGRKDLVTKYLWDPKEPSESVIRRDLEYILKVWNLSSFDLWEEVNGIHFFTMLVQRKALKVGAMFAKAIGEHKDAARYAAAYRTLTLHMEKFWDSYRGIFLSTLSRTGGIDYKYSNVDSSIFIGVNFAQITDSTVGQVDDSRLIRTFAAQEKIFSEIYPINQNSKLPPMIGRYPEDRYNGVNNSIGNPWFITTHAFAEYLYNLSTRIGQRGAVKVDALTRDFYEGLGVEIKDEEIIPRKDPRFKKIIEKLMEKADGYLTVGQKFTGPSYRMAEQVNRFNGTQQGAGDLTWSYASYISAYFARHRGNKVLYSTRFR